MRTGELPDVPGYRVVRRIDRGDGVASYLATDDRGRHVECLPTADGDPSGRGSPLRAPEHPHLVALLDVVDSSIGQVSVIEYLQGGTVLALLRKSGALTLGQMATVMSPVGSAVERLHALGRTHGAVAGRFVFIAASGMPKLLSPDVVRTLGVPEVTPEDAARRADVRDMGALAWALLTGREPVADRSRPPIRVYHPDLPDRLADAIDDSVRFTAAEFAAVFREPAGIPAAPLRLTATDEYEPGSEALTAQLRLTALTAAGQKPRVPAPEPRAGRAAKPAARTRSSGRRRARHRRPGHRRALWIACGAALLACAILAGFAVNAGGSSEARSAVPARMEKTAESADPARAIEALVRMRAHMFVTGDPAKLSGLDVPKSTAWREDSGKLRTLQRAGARLDGLEMTVTDADVVRRSKARAVVNATIDISRYRQVDASGRVSDSRDGRTEEIRFTLVRHGGRWLISAAR